MDIKYLPNQPLCFAFGGFELQMLNALEAVQNQGVNAQKLNYWEEKKDFELLHIWGSGDHHFNTIRWAKKANKKIVATVLLSYFDTLRLKLSYIKNYSFYKRQQHYFYNQLDAIVVVNEMQKQILISYYNVDKDKIYIIPNIVNERFFKQPEMSFSKVYNIEDYILCVGNICRRKNQINLAKACFKSGNKLVLIGNALVGEDTYAKDLEQITNNSKDILWIKELDNRSDELISAYYDCKLFALPSLQETQPISALEARVAKKQLVLLNKAYAKQEYYAGSIFAKSHTVNSISDAITYAIKNQNFPNCFNNDIVIDNCTKKIVGDKYKNLYNSVLNN